MNFIVSAHTLIFKINTIQHFENLSIKLSLGCGRGK